MHGFDSIGRAYVIDYLGSTKSRQVSQKLKALGFTVKEDIRNIQLGPSCGYNAAAIIAQMDFAFRTDSASWWNASYENHVYSLHAGNRSKNEKNVDMIKRANEFLGSNEESPFWLSSSQVTDLVNFYKSYFDFVPNQLTNNDVFNWIRDPMPPAQFERLVEDQCRKYKGVQKMKEKLFFCIVNTDNTTGQHWYVVGLHFFEKNLDSGATVTVNEASKSPSNPARGVKLKSNDSDQVEQVAGECEQLSQPAENEASLRVRGTKRNFDEASEIEKKSVPTSCFDFKDDNGDETSLIDQNSFMISVKEYIETVIDKRKSDYIPICLHALVYLHRNFYCRGSFSKRKKSTAKNILDALPDFLGYFKNPTQDNLRNAKRRINFIAELVQNHDKISAAYHKLKVPNLDIKHLGYQLVKGRPCEICFQEHNIRNSEETISGIKSSASVQSDSATNLAKTESIRTRKCTEDEKSDQEISLCDTTESQSESCSASTVIEPPILNPPNDCSDRGAPKLNRNSEPSVNCLKSDPIQCRDKKFEDKLIDLIEEELKSQSVNQSADDMLQRIFKCIVPFLTNKYPAEKKDIKLWQKSFDHGRPLLVSLQKNIQSFEENLRKNARYLWYGLRLSNEQVKNVCKIMLCQTVRPLDIEERVKKLPKIENITSTYKDYRHSMVTDEYLNSLKIWGKEPNFSKLGQKFEL